MSARLTKLPGELELVVAGFRADATRLRAERDRLLVRGAHLYSALRAQTDRASLLEEEHAELLALARAIVSADDRAHGASWGNLPPHIGEAAARERTDALGRIRQFLDSRRRGAAAP